MFTLAGEDYPLTFVEAATAYPHGSAFCDGCGSRIPYLSHCYHSRTIFGSQQSGFDLCQTCHDGVRFHESKTTDRPLPTINSRVRIVRLLNKPDLNGKLGVVVRKADKPDRVGVRMDDDDSVVLSVHAKNLLIERHFFMVEDDTLRILAPSTAEVKVNGEPRADRVIAVDTLPDVEKHSIQIDNHKYRFSLQSCSICMTSDDSLRRFAGHPARVCDACAAAIEGQACPFCRSTTGEHVAQTTTLEFLQLPLASRDIRFFAKMASLRTRYTIVSSTTQLELKVKPMDFDDDYATRAPVFRGGGATRSMDDACAAAVTGNGSSVTIRPPAGCTIDAHGTYADEMMFDDVVAFDSILYRLTDCDNVHKSAEFLDGRRALERARFNPTEKRVAIVLSVIDGSGNAQSIYVFFSVNLRMPGIVVLMPDPDAETAQQCVTIVDFYDPRFWRSSHPAVNHNSLASYRRAYCL